MVHNGTDFHHLLDGASKVQPFALCTSFSYFTTNLKPFQVPKMAAVYLIFGYFGGGVSLTWAAS